MNNSSMELSQTKPKLIDGALVVVRKQHEDSQVLEDSQPNGYAEVLDEIKTENITTCQIKRNGVAIGTFKCGMCWKTFGSKRLLNKHIKRKHNWIGYLKNTGENTEDGLSCDLRKKTFSARTHVKRHKSLNCKSRNEDNIDTKESQVILNERENIHDTTKPLKKHECTICGKVFKRRYHLTVHSNIHLEKKPYDCNYCTKDFAQQFQKKIHMNKKHPDRTTTEETGKSCNMCLDIFENLSALTEHVKLLHNSLGE